MVNISYKGFKLLPTFNNSSQISLQGPYPYFYGGRLHAYGISKDKKTYVKSTLTSVFDTATPEGDYVISGSYLYALSRGSNKYYRNYYTDNGDGEWDTITFVGGTHYALEKVPTGFARADATFSITNEDADDNKPHLYYNYQLYQEFVPGAIGDSSVGIGRRGLFWLESAGTNEWYYFIHASDYKIKRVRIIVEDPIVLSDVYTGNSGEYPTEVMCRISDSEWYCQFNVGGTYKVYKSTNQGVAWSEVAGSSGKYLYTSDTTYIYCTNIGHTASTDGQLEVYRYSTGGGWEQLFNCRFEGSTAVQGIAIETSTSDIAVAFSNVTGSTYTNYILMTTDISEEITSCNIHRKINGERSRCLIQTSRNIAAAMPMGILQTIYKADGITVLFQGYTIPALDNAGKPMGDGIILLEGIDREILNEDVDATFTTQTAHQIFDTITSALTDLSTGSIAATSDQYTYTINAKKAQVLQRFAYAEDGLFRINPDGTIDLKLYASLASASLVFNDQSLNVYERSFGLEEEPIESARWGGFLGVRLFGGYDSLGPIKKTNGTAPYKDITMLDITDDQLAINLQARLWADFNVSNADARIYHIVAYGSEANPIEQPKPGDTVTFAFSPYNVAQDTFIILEQMYNAVSRTCDLWLCKIVPVQALIEMGSLLNRASTPGAADSVGGTPVTQTSIGGALAGTFAAINADLPMNNHKITDLADAVDLDEAVNYGQLLDHVRTTINFWFGNTTLVSALTNSPAALTETTDADPDTLTNIYFKSSVADTPAPFTIESGTIIAIHFSAKVTATAGKKTVGLYFQFGYVDADGTSNFTQIGANSDQTADLTADKTLYEIHCHVSSQITVPAGKRLWLKVVANTAGAGLEPEVNVYYNDPTCHITFGQSGTLGNFVQKNNANTLGDSFTAVPATDNTIDIATSAKRIKTAYLNKLYNKHIETIDLGNFKGLYALDWGTSGTPSGLNAYHSTLTIEDKTHLAVVKAVGTDTNPGFWTASLGDLTTAYFSCWVWIGGTNDDFQINIRDADSNDTIYVHVAKATGVVTFVGTGTTTCNTITQAAWNHFCILVTQNATSYLFHNGTLVGAQTATNNEVNHAFIWYESADANTDTFWVDAYYHGTDGRQAFSSLFDGAINAQQVLTAYGPKGYHPLDFLDKSDAAFFAETATDNDTVILDWFNGDYESKSAGITVNTDNMSLNIVPPNALAIVLALTVMGDTANVANTLVISRNGQTNKRQVLQVRCASASGYYNHGQGVVQLDDDGKTMITFHRGAGTVYLYVELVGYWL